MAIDYPAGPDGRRSSLAFGQAVLADTTAAAGRETDWRKGYLRHFAEPWSLDQARAGLASIYRRVSVPDLSGSPVPAAETIEGSGTPEREVTLPYRGSLLRGDGLRAQLDTWVADGIIEESCAAAVRAVVDHPEWLDLSDRTVVVLGAGAEMGPLAAVLGWGGTVIGVDLPRPQLWDRVTAVAGKSAGRLVALRADLLEELPAVAGFLTAARGPLVLGNYVYAPGAVHARLAIAVDALGEHLRQQRGDVTLAGLATPTDAFRVPPAAVTQSRARYANRSARAKLGQAVSGGKLLRPNYPEGAPPICDGLFGVQGPNYALAKRILRWRTAVARHEGAPVCFGVAPATRTRSVTSNRLLAAAYSGAHLFGVEIFEPATASKLMALLLVHQLRSPSGKEHDEAYAAAHGGLWRAAYQPRSSLSLAAIRGLTGRGAHR